jgi:hypothetical protein
MEAGQAVGKWSSPSAEPLAAGLRQGLNRKFSQALAEKPGGDRERRRGGARHAGDYIRVLGASRR